MRRVVAVLAGPVDPAAAAVPDPLRAAMLEDVIDLAHEIPLSESAVVVAADDPGAAEALTWPGMATYAVTGALTLAAAATAAAGAGEAHVVVLAPDAPDLPAMAVGKLFSALTGASIAVCPAEGGGLVAAGLRAPVVPWLLDAAPRLDDAAVLARLRAAAAPGDLQVVPGWHRVRGLADVDRLDRGLEGWEATRVWLDAQSP